jgi:hypothetical protein
MRASRPEFSKNRPEEQKSKRGTNRISEDKTWRICNRYKPDTGSGGPTKELICSEQCSETTINNRILTTIIGTIIILLGRMIVLRRKKTKREDWTKNSSRD